MLDRFDFTGKVAVITGAGDGIGKAAACKFYEAGAMIVLVDRDVERLIDLERKNGWAEHRYLCCHADVSIENDVSAYIQKAVQRFGRIDVMFNNAGISINKPVIEVTQEDLIRYYSTNVWSIYYNLKHVIPTMSRTGGGSIINTASVDGFSGAINNTIYAGTKHAVLGLSKCAALETADKDIRINCICPGAVNTNIIRSYIEEGTAEEKAQREAYLKNLIPMGRFLEPDEVADYVLFLASDLSKYMTGSKLVIDGGRTLE